MADESLNSFDTMRRDAIRRVQEMQRRSRRLLSPERDDPKQPEDQFPAPPAAGRGRDALFDLAGIHIDEEKALIGMLIYILYKQGADIKLLLALGYLLL